jgi:hypothetical protein
MRVKSLIALRYEGKTIPPGESGVVEREHLSEREVTVNFPRFNFSVNPRVNVDALEVYGIHNAIYPLAGAGIGMLIKRLFAPGSKQGPYILIGALTGLLVEFSGLKKLRHNIAEAERLRTRRQLKGATSQARRPEEEEPPRMQSSAGAPE